MGWDKSKDELREEVSRQQNVRKKTNRWCKGKVGREHEPELVVNHNVVRITCGWRRYRFWGQQQWNWGPYRYSCKHAYRCKNCGKYTEYVLKNHKECPEYKERPEAVLVEYAPGQE